MEPITLAVDAMGGDFAPQVVVEGVCAAVNQSDIKILLVGQPEAILPHLKKASYPDDRIEIVPAAHAIPMDASPKKALDDFPDASMVKAARLVQSGAAEALISAGNTGALVLSAARNIPRIQNVHRTALAAVYPTLNELQRKDIFALMLDVGANVMVEPENLIHFALMGSSYASEVKGIPDPAVALLNMGSEPNKGGPRYSETYQILSDLAHINFIGNIEGHDLLRGVADVVVTEGLVGNVAIKTLEGSAETVMGLGKMAFKQKFIWKIGLIMLSSGIRGLKKLTDYQEYGGAPILGLNKLVLKCHGKSTSHAILNAIKLAAKSIRDDLTGSMQRSIRTFEETITKPGDSFITGYDT